jgi:uncharacterized protein (TIGR03437 family)
MICSFRSAAATIFILAWLEIALAPAGYGQSYGLQTIAGTTTIKDAIPANTAFLRDPAAVVADSAGNIYIADRSDNRVRKVSRDGTITTIAGTGFPGDDNDGGPGIQGELNTPFQLAIDKNNNLYIGEYLSGFVRKLNLTTGILTTVAGNGAIAASPHDGAKATQAAIDPEGLAVDSKGNLIISDGANHRIRKVAPEGTISTIAGFGGCGDSGDNQLATLAQICFPTELGIDAADNIYFIDYANSRVRMIAAQTGMMAPYLGYDGVALDWNDGFPANQTPVYYPDALGVDAAGNLYCSENDRIRYVPSGGGIVTTVAGIATLGFSGDKGAATAAKVAFPAGIFAFANGDFLLADTGNFRIRKVTSGAIDTIAGVSIVDGLPALSSLFNGPSGIAEDTAGNLYIADTFNNRIRKLTATTGTISTIAGTGTAGAEEGRIATPDGIAIDSRGLIYFADTGNDRILQIQPDGSTAVIAGGNGNGYSGDGSFAKNALLNGPGAVAIDKSDNIYFADSGNNRVRKITPADGLIHLVAGNGKVAFSGDGASATSAGMSPHGLAIDTDGTLYIADWANSRVRRVDASSGNISTMAGTGKPGSAGDGGKATAALLYSPNDVAIDLQHNLLIADQVGFVVRRVNLTTGIIITIAGTGAFGFSGETGAATETTFSPTRVFVEKNGNLIVSDTYNDRIRRLTPLVAKTLSINMGDQQSGIAGASLPISAVVTDSNKYPIQGVAVSFTVTSGTAALSSPNATTAVDGTASNLVTLGAALGAVTIRADSPGLNSVTFTLSVIAPPVVAPVISAVVGAPQSTPPVTTISMNGTVLVFLAPPNGTTLCQSGTSCTTATFSPPQTPRYATNLANTCVTVGGVSAPLFTASGTVVGIIIPNLPYGPADVVVTASCGTGGDIWSAPFSVVVADASPELTYSLITPDPFYYITAVDTATQTAVGNPLLGPAMQGEAISISAVGLGATNPVEPIGDVSADMATVTGSVIVTLGRNPLPPEAILFVGLAPNTTPGVYRIDIVVPMDAAPGDQPVTIQINDDISPAGLLTIGSPASQSSRDSRKTAKDETRPFRKPRIAK